MRTISIRTSLCLAAVAGAASLYATGASTAATLVGDHYEETIRRSNCTNVSAFACQLPMATVPTGKKLLVTNVSCAVSYTGVPTFHAFLLSHQAGSNTDAGDPTYTYLLPAIVPFTGNPASRSYIVNMQTNQLFTAGQKPMIYQNIGQASFGRFDCTIIGTMMPAAS
jgi:hypothetical protein